MAMRLGGGVVDVERAVMRDSEKRRWVLKVRRVRGSVCVLMEDCGGGGGGRDPSAQG